MLRILDCPAQYREMEIKRLRIVTSLVAVRSRLWPFGVVNLAVWVRNMHYKFCITGIAVSNSGIVVSYFPESAVS